MSARRSSRNAVRDRTRSERVEFSRGGANLGGCARHESDECNSHGEIHGRRTEKGFARRMRTGNAWSGRGPDGAERIRSGDGGRGSKNNRNTDRESSKRGVAPIN